MDKQRTHTKANQPGSPGRSRCRRKNRDRLQVTCLLLDVGPSAWSLQVSRPQSLCQRDARSANWDGCHMARPADSWFLPGQAVSGSVGKFIVAVQAHALQVLCCARRHTRTVSAQGGRVGVGRRAPSRADFTRPFSIHAPDSLAGFTRPCSARPKKTNSRSDPLLPRCSAVFLTNGSIEPICPRLPTTVTYYVR